MSATPRLPRSLATLQVTPPGLVTAAALGASVDLARDLRVGTVMIGHGRDGASCENAVRFTSAWQDAGGIVLDRVSWPDEAASWLRQARRLVTPEPDLWILGGAAQGLVQMVRRLRWSTAWCAGRTLAVGTTISDALQFDVGGATEGMRGAYPDGRIWRIVDGLMQVSRPAENGRNVG